jgi:hypothetical protein
LKINKFLILIFYELYYNRFIETFNKVKSRFSMEPIIAGASDFTNVPLKLHNKKELQSSEDFGQEIRDVVIGSAKEEPLPGDALIARMKTINSGETEDPEKFKDNAITGLSLDRALPSILELPHRHKKIHKLLSTGCANIFRAGAVSYIGACAVAAVIPNLINRFTKKSFSQEQIDEMKKHLKTGDIVLTNSNQHQTFYFLVHSLYGHKYSHAATYVGEGQVIDSYDKPAVQNINELFARMSEIAVLRPEYQSSTQVYKQIDYLAAQIGKPYNMLFNTEDERAFYCSELTLRGLEASGLNTKIPGHCVMRQPFVLPDDFIKGKNFKIVKVFKAEE